MVDWATFGWILLGGVAAGLVTVTIDAFYSQLVRIRRSLQALVATVYRLEGYVEREWGRGRGDRRELLTGGRWPLTASTAVFDESVFGSSDPLANPESGCYDVEPTKEAPDGEADDLHQ